MAKKGHVRRQSEPHSGVRKVQKVLARSKKCIPDQYQVENACFEGIGIRWQENKAAAGASDINAIDFGPSALGS